MKGIFCILVSTVLILGCSQAEENPKNTAPKTNEVKPEAPAAPDEEKAAAPEEEKAAAPAEPKAEPSEQLVLLDTEKGRVFIRLFDKDAPEHAKSFRNLVSKGFYDGTYFHRLVDNFVVQGGDPNTKDDIEMNDGTGGPGYKVKNESNRNKHERGRVAAARTADPDSAGSQFYICLRDLPQLDQARYTVFGEVLEGMDVVDKINSVPKKSLRPGGERSYPLEKTHIKKASLISAEDLK